MARMSETQELLTETRERLAQARLAANVASRRDGRDRPGNAPQKGTGMPKTIRELRQERGESRSDLAAAVGVTLSELTDWELGSAQPGVARVRLLTEHFGVRSDQINLEPNRPPTIGEQLRDALSE
jgi:DNA-binding transcriptional regulator YiaG